MVQSKAVVLATKQQLKAKRRDSFWAVTPFLSVVTVLTPATTWTEGFTNRLIVTDYSEKFPRWQPREIEKRIMVLSPQPAMCMRAYKANKKTGED
ncbi:MAG: hypothetical protein WAL47_00095 [Pyrinomonadaceae bacterium]